MCKYLCNNFYFELFFFSSVQADTIKWLHLTGESSPEYPNFVRAVEEFEAKTGHKVEMMYLENESFKAKLPTMLQSDDRPDIFNSWGGGVMYAKAEAGQRAHQECCDSKRFEMESSSSFSLLADKGFG